MVLRMTVSHSGWSTPSSVQQDVSHCGMASAAAVISQPISSMAKAGSLSTGVPARLKACSTLDTTIELVAL